MRSDQHYFSRAADIRRSDHLSRYRHDRRSPGGRIIFLHPLADIRIRPDPAGQSAIVESLCSFRHTLHGRFPVRIVLPDKLDFPGMHHVTVCELEHCDPFDIERNLYIPVVGSTPAESRSLHGWFSHIHVQRRSFLSDTPRAPISLVCDSLDTAFVFFNRWIFKHIFLFLLGDGRDLPGHATLEWLPPDTPGNNFCRFPLLSGSTDPVHSANIRFCIIPRDDWRCHCNHSSSMASGVPIRRFPSCSMSH